MQTIQFSLEAILYDYIPENKNAVVNLTEINILALRRYFFVYAQNYLREMD